MNPPAVIACLGAELLLAKLIIIILKGDILDLPATKQKEVIYILNSVVLLQPCPTLPLQF